MHTKTMEGLVGANTNMHLLNTPFRVYKEASRRGDTAAMERAMGYVTECSDKAGEYMEKAESGMKEDAKEARERAEAERESTVWKRRKEQEELEKRIEEGRNGKTDTVEISESGKAVWSEEAGLDQSVQEGSVSAGTKADAVKVKPVIYTKTGEVYQGLPESDAGVSVSV